MGKYSMCAQCILKWSSRYLTVYVCARNGCLCACVCTYSTYKCDFNLIVPYCSQERTGQAASEASCFGSWHSPCPSRDGRRGRCTLLLGTIAGDKSDNRGQRENVHTQKQRWGFSLVVVTNSYLADVVWADGGDGLEGQLLAAHTHEYLLHLAQKILLK